MLAVIKTGGKQYPVTEGKKLRIEKIEGEAGEAATFSEVLFWDNGSEAKIGTPTVAGSKVEAKILKQDKADKVWGIKHKAKKRTKVKFGHRQPYTEIEITKIA